MARLSCLTLDERKQIEKLLKEGRTIGWSPVTTGRVIARDLGLVYKRRSNKILSERVEALEEQIKILTQFIKETVCPK